MYVCMYVHTYVWFHNIRVQQRYVYNPYCIDVLIVLVSMSAGTLTRLLSDVVAVAYIQLPPDEFQRTGASTVTTPTNEYLIKVHMGERRHPDLTHEGHPDLAHEGHPDLTHEGRVAVDSIGTNILDHQMDDLDVHTIQVEYMHT